MIRRRNSRSSRPVTRFLQPLTFVSIGFWYQFLVQVVVVITVVASTTTSTFASAATNSTTTTATTTTTTTTTPFANKLPTLVQTVTLGHLSRLVYKFEYDSLTTNCTSFNDHSYPRTDDTPLLNNVHCEWYHHDSTLGTQVLLVTDPIAHYVAVVFAGTDDLRTSLEDANILTMPFGNNDTIQLPTKLDFDKPLPSNWIRVHAGFNHAVFLNGIWEEVYNRTMSILTEHPEYTLWTTGHSLGASCSIMTATAFATVGQPCRSISFGSPQTGNYYWKNYFNNTSPLQNTLGIFRVVLAWDLVARLPELFYHVGHTIQLDGSNITEIRAYYQHYGNVEMKLAGVPFGWSSKSYAFLPWALGYHRISKYVKHLEQIRMTNTSAWPTEFVPIPSSTNGGLDDDDCYDNPPDDFFVSDQQLDYYDMEVDSDDDAFDEAYDENYLNEDEEIELSIFMNRENVNAPNQLRQRRVNEEQPRRRNRK